MSKPVKAYEAPLPSPRQLAKATCVAALVAGALLVTTILPAEYGIDPTGIGRLLGLTQMGTSKQTPPAERRTNAIGVDGPALAWARGTGMAETMIDADTQSRYRLAQSGATERSDEVTLTLKPNESAEVKAFMKTGDEMKYAWSTTGGRLNFEFHGEPPNAPSNVFTSYAKGTRDKAEGTFKAKFDGTHGWFWRNRTSQPITVTVKTVGRYEKLARVK
jgi:hypothetical protein